MIDKQNAITITSEEAIERFGSYYFISKENYEDFNLKIIQILGSQPQSDSKIYADSEEEAIALHDATLKEHCKNAISRYGKDSKTIRGEVIYFLHKQNMLKEKKQKEVAEYIKIIDEARRLLSTGKKPVFTKLSGEYLIPKTYPHVGDHLYVVNKDIADDFFEIETFNITENTIHVSSSGDIKEVHITSHLNKEGKDRGYIISTKPDSDSDSGRISYSLAGYSKLAFINLDDAKEYADKRLSEVIEKATLAKEKMTTKNS